MSEIKHTPGPWVADGDQIIPWFAGDDENVNEGYRVADTYGPDCTANARLIAAAPELLEVVKAFIVETVDYATINKLGDPEKQHNVKWARSVIAKAEGKS